MKNFFIILFLSVSTTIFSQGNFTTEWESPAGWSLNTPIRGKGIIKLISSTNVYHIALADINDEHNVRFYNGSTHNLDYSWTWIGTNSSFYPNGILDYEGEIYSANKFDVNGDGINEFIQYRESNATIVDPVNGNALYTTTEVIGYIIDIDGDGFIELIQYSVSGTKIISTPAQTVSVNNSTEIVTDYNLKQNYPNPFNPSTTIEYNLNKNSDVKIVIYDILGKEVNTLVNQKQVPGVYKLNLNASELSSGTYFYSLIVDGVAESRKMILIK